MKSSTSTSKSILAAALAAIALTSAPASAQGVDYTAIFNAADLDLSGNLSIPEFTSTLKAGTSPAAAWKKLLSADWNHNHTIELREFLVFVKAAPKPSKATIDFDLADGDSNGSITFDHYDYYMVAIKETSPSLVSVRRNFLRADANGDTIVTREEYTAFGNGDYDRTKVSLFTLADDGDDGFLSLIEFGYTYPRGFAESKIVVKFDKEDENDDGVLTRSEWNPGVRPGSEL